MSLRDDAIVIGVVGVAVVVGLWFAKNAIAKVIPQSVKDGAEAAAVLTWEGIKGITHPLDALGVSSPVGDDGVPGWQPTAPWQNPDDQVSNSDSGINWNYL